jgi:hypothetical protein
MGGVKEGGVQRGETAAGGGAAGRFPVRGGGGIFHFQRAGARYAAFNSGANGS